MNMSVNTNNTRMITTSKWFNSKRSYNRLNSIGATSTRRVRALTTTTSTSYDPTTTMCSVVASCSSSARTTRRRRRRSEATRLHSSSSGSSQGPPSGTLEIEAAGGGGLAQQALLESEARLKYLEALVTLRTLYRSFLRAQYWIEQPHPMSSSHPSLDTNKGDGKGLKGGKFKGISEEEDDSIDEEEELAFALDAVAEMALTSDQLSSQLQKLPMGFCAVFESLKDSSYKSENNSNNNNAATASQSTETTSESTNPNTTETQKEVSSSQNSASIESSIMSFGKELSQSLANRLEKELDSLPFKSKADAWSAVRQLITNEAIDTEEWDMTGGGSANGGGEGFKQRSILQGERAFRRVRRAEKAAEKLVERVRASSKGMMIMQSKGGADTINATASYMKDVWIRLNGGGTTGLDLVPFPEDLPRPAAISKKASVVFDMGQASELISIDVDKLDKELREASKSREMKLRKAGVLERARMDSDLKEAEEKVNDLRLQLALRTLQLELRLVFEILEKEALQIIDENNNFLPWRRGSSEELALLVAEYALLDRKTASLIGSNNQGGSRLGEQELLSELATDVPDLRTRLGITDNEVVTMSLDTRIKNIVLIVEDSGNKVKDSFVFMGTGVKLLVTDMSMCGKLFGRALVGGTLQPREVETLRRTARDLLTFVPFIIILILPITPVGHVLVFSFIQQNFPALFPSQFTSARQKSMRRYETLKKQLDDVLEQDGLKWREEQFNKAVEAVEALTSNITKVNKSNEATGVELELESSLMDTTNITATGGGGGDTNPTQQETTKTK